MKQIVINEVWKHMKESPRDEEFPENDHQGHAYEGDRENDTLEKRIQCQR